MKDAATELVETLIKEKEFLEKIISEKDQQIEDLRIYINKLSASYFKYNKYRLKEELMETLTDLLLERVSTKLIKNPRY